VAEVLVTGAEGELQAEVYRVIRTRPGRTTTQSQVQQDINAIFATGFFADVRTTAQDTPLGVRVTFEVLVNPVLQAIEVQGNTIRTLRVKPPDGKDVPLPYPQIITDIFSSQYGKVLNLVQLQEGIKKLNKIYRDNGYDLAQVPDAFRVAPNGAIVPQITVSDSGTVILQVAEGVVEGIRVRYFDKDGNECVRDDKGAFFLRTTEGQPVLDKNNRPSGCRNRTREFIITREFELKTGDVFNREVLQRDLQRVFGLGILEDVKLSLNPGTDPRQVVVLVDVTERNTGSIAAGAGISSSSGLFGTLSYQQQNFGGNNQKLGGEVQIGTSRSELLFDLNFTDPWIANDPFRTSYTLNLFKRRTISLVFDGGDDEIRLPNGDRPRVHRTGGGISFSRPLSRDVFRRSEWAASLGFQYQRVAIRDADSDLNFRDELGNKLSFSDSGKDDLFTIQFGAVRDRRNDPLRPTSGSLLRVGTEQSIPIGQGNILLNRLRGGYSFYVPTRLLKLSPGCRAANARVADCPQTFAFNVQAGTVVGDLPPYEAFALGGSNSVRGYDEGDLASTRSFLQATVEYRFPIFSVISGAVFVDAATDFGSQGSVPGDPGGVRNKPGSGIGYGLGVRIQSPLGPIRIDYGFNDQGDGRLHFGIGERF
jgi:outer membrane protein insertion porin family